MAVTVAPFRGAKLMHWYPVIIIIVRVLASGKLGRNGTPEVLKIQMA